MNLKIKKEIDIVNVLGALGAFVAWLGAITFGVIGFGFYIENRVNGVEQKVDFIQHQQEAAEYRHEKAMGRLETQLRELNRKIDKLRD